MKLLAKYNRVNIPITIATLLISSIGFYFIIHFVLIHQLDKDLRIEQEEIIHYIKEKGTLPEASNYRDQQIEFLPATNGHFKTSLVTERGYGKSKERNKSFRTLQFLVNVNGINYIAQVKKSLRETEDIIQLILAIIFLVIAFLLLVLFVANRFLLAKLWKPFNHTLEQLKQFNLSSKNKIILQQTEINEFKDLNETVLSMTKKVTSDYESLKKFTENASHEIQTPLAIIKNKIELLSQSENLGEPQINIIQNLNDATSRLSKLNQSLLLLTKIENRQFENNDKVNLSFILNNCLENYEELAGIKGIVIEKNIPENIFIKMNDSLAEVLVSNIIINAIKHNYQHGNIKVDLTPNDLAVRNTGNVPHENTEGLLERFRKDSTSGDSIGLGLSIVKTICDTYSFSISYNFEDGIHIVKVVFNLS